MEMVKTGWSSDPETARGWAMDPDVAKRALELSQAQQELDHKSAALSRAEEEHAKALRRWRDALAAFQRGAAPESAPAPALWHPGSISVPA